MVKVVSVEHMRKIEAEADANGLTYAEMMDRAGYATARRAARMVADIPSPQITVLVGKGNNGGDGLTAAHYLATETEAEMRVYMLERQEEPSAPLQGVLDAGLFITYAEDDHDRRVLRHMVASADLLLDALFGIGVRLPIKSEAAQIMRTVNQALKARKSDVPEDLVIDTARPNNMPKIAYTRVLAVDCPSGLNNDTGEHDAHVIPADETITFIAAKYGQIAFPGAQYVGYLSVAPLGVSQDLDSMKSAEDILLDTLEISASLPQRPADSNKGTFGKALLVAGSVNYSGAPALAADAAYRSGTGLITVGAPGPVIASLSAKTTEPTWLVLAHDMGVLSENAAELLQKEMVNYDAMLLGPGWDQEETTGKLLDKLLEGSTATQSTSRTRRIGFNAHLEDDEADSTADAQPKLPPLVIDADGLNLLAKFETWWEKLPKHTIITPHPGEMARLANNDVASIQAARLETARSKAQEWNLVIVLKGAHTVIAEPDGKASILPFKSDALATAGTGDILAGLITGLLAQGMPAYNAGRAGAYIHGLAGELAANEHGSTRGITAGDVARFIPRVWRAIEHA